MKGLIHNSDSRISILLFKKEVGPLDNFKLSNNLVVAGKIKRVESYWSFDYDLENIKTPMLASDFQILKQLHHLGPFMITNSIPGLRGGEVQYLSPLFVEVTQEVTALLWTRPGGIILGAETVGSRHPDFKKVLKIGFLHYLRMTQSPYESVQMPDFDVNFDKVYKVDQA